MKFTVSYQDQKLDLDMPTTISVKRMKEELQRIFNIKTELSLELTTKKRFLEEEYLLTDYHVSQGDLITVLEGIDGNKDNKISV